MRTFVGSINWNDSALVVFRTLENYVNRGDLAQRLGTNDRYIADAISEGSGGQTFLQFVNGYRLARATRLLTETDEPIEQIAFDSGFNNRRTFNRVFRDEYEMSPSDFRRASKEKA